MTASQKRREQESWRNITGGRQRSKSLHAMQKTPIHTFKAEERQGPEKRGMERSAGASTRYPRGFPSVREPFFPALSFQFISNPILFTTYIHTYIVLGNVV